MERGSRPTCKRSRRADALSLISFSNKPVPDWRSELNASRVCELEVASESEMPAVTHPKGWPEKSAGNPYGKPLAGTGRDSAAGCWGGSWVARAQSDQSLKARSAFQKHMDTGSCRTVLSGGVW